MQHNNSYKFGGNAFWANFLKFAAPSVHTNPEAIAQAKKQFMRPGGDCNLGELVLEVEESRTIPLISLALLPC